jgi:hypothetical protein
MRLYGAMMLSEHGDDKRNIMTTTIQQMHPVAYLPLVLDSCCPLALPALAPASQPLRAPPARGPYRKETVTRPPLG